MFIVIIYTYTPVKNILLNYSVYPGPVLSQCLVVRLKFPINDNSINKNRHIWKREQAFWAFFENVFLFIFL